MKVKRDSWRKRRRRENALGLIIVMPYFWLLCIVALLSVGQNHCGQDETGSFFQLKSDTPNWLQVGSILSGVNCASGAVKLADQPQVRAGPNRSEQAGGSKKVVNNNKAPGRAKQVVKPAEGGAFGGGGGGQGVLRRKQAAKVRLQSEQEDDSRDLPAAGLQISITPRVGQIRVPVESNTILKCLISSQSNKFARKFDIHWSRYMYDENVYEQIESFDGLDSTSPSSLVASPELGAGPQAAEYNPANKSTNSAIPKRTARRLGQAMEDHLLEAQPREGNSESLVNEFLDPVNRQQQLRDFLARSRQESNAISELLIEATLSISPVRASDNASYYCTASDGVGEQGQARIDLVALSRPIVHLDRVQPARDSKSALIYWLVLNEGNTPIKKTILMVRNDSSSPGSSARFPPASSSSSLAPNGADETSASQQYSSSVVLDSDYNHWQRIEIPDEGGGGAELAAARDHDASGHRELYSQSVASAPAGAGQVTSGDSVVGADVDVTSTGGQQVEAERPTGGAGSSRWRWKSSRFNRRQRSYNLSSLLPGVSYNFRLAAINDMGQSNWSQLSATMPNEIPAQIGEVFQLSRSNDSLAVGWRRPSWDGAKTIRYEMQLFDLNRTLTLDANTNTSALTPRTNFMYIFVNLNPGTDYHFHVRACSRSGCSLYSSPKLLASTLDGEPDEPMDVELSCPQAEGLEETGDNRYRYAGDRYGNHNLTVSWLPPINSRGQLLNYSVLIDSYARFKNSSNEWQVDEWRTTIETADNHTLSLDIPANNLLSPNTNYSVRVCANNRSKHCGRPSSVSSRSQCSSKPELPLQLAAADEIKFAARELAQLIKQLEVDERSPLVVNLKQQIAEAPNVESLLLEFPFISQRNGSLDCIQIVLIRLPKSFKLSEADYLGQLSEFLPPKPSDIKLAKQLHSEAAPAVPDAAEPAGTVGHKPAQELALAYLAEEIEPNRETKISGPPPINLAGAEGYRLVLGDGIQQVCGGGSQQSGLDRARVFDAALKPQTFYTGFIKVILARGDSDRQLESRSPASARALNSSRQEKLAGKRAISPAKYSQYFKPIRVGDLVLEVPRPSELDSSGDDQSAHLNTLAEQNLNGQTMSVGQMLARVGASLRTSARKLYTSGSNLVADNVRLDSIGNFIMQSSPVAQLFEFGLIVVGLSLALLLLAYLLSLPASVRRKRKRKLKRQLQRHQEQARAASRHLQELEEKRPEQAANGNAPAGPGLGFGRGPQAVDVGVLGSSIGYQQVSMESSKAVELELERRQKEALMGSNGNGGYLVAASAADCPIHSSPLAISRQQASNVHLCQPDILPAEQVQDGVYLHGHHHHHHHHTLRKQQHQQQLQLQQQQQQLQQQQQVNYAYHQDANYARNCMTTARRSSAGVPVGFEASEQQRLLAAASGAMSQSGNSNKNLTLNPHNSVLAFARKINKPIPLRLFNSVFECRLRNGWLREEYEQLPKHQPLFVAPGTSSRESKPLRIKLKPQLVVSRNDSVSALISGNDQFDATLIKLQVPSPPPPGMPEGAPGREIICAKSPLDADSVWDFWRLIYEQDVCTLVMLTQIEDPNTGETRCAQYWPTCDNEETTILSPGNEFVKNSHILPAKFKIRQETLMEESRPDDFRVRQLTLLVMASKPGDNEPKSGSTQVNQPNSPVDPVGANNNVNNDDEDDDDDDDEKLLIVERKILHLQFYHWNTSSLSNQMRLIKFIELANERHLRVQREADEEGGGGGGEGAGTGTGAGAGRGGPKLGCNSPMLVHCFNGLGRSGLFAAMSFVIDELSIRLNYPVPIGDQRQQQQSKINLFNLVAKLRSQREMLLSPYKLYELLYQLTANCLPPTRELT